MDWTSVTTSFVTLFVVIDPLGVAPAFATLTQEAGFGRRWRTALAGTLIAALILTAFAIGGAALLGAVGIGMPAFRTAGGILLFIMGLEMIFERRTPRRSRSAEQSAAEQHGEGEAEDSIAVFPLAIPLLAGPGAIASVVLLMTSAAGWQAQGAVFVALALVLLITFPLLVFASQLLAWAGRSASILITRLMGVLLTALSVQFVFDGVREGVLNIAA